MLALASIAPALGLADILFIFNIDGSAKSHNIYIIVYVMIITVIIQRLYNQVYVSTCGLLSLFADSQRSTLQIYLI